MLTLRADERIPLTTAGRRQLEEEAARVEAHMAELRDMLTEAHEDRSADEDERAAALGLLDELGRAEARLAELRALLDRSIAAAPADQDIVGIGTVVRLRDDDGDESEYTLVTPAEAAPSTGRVSVDAPLGQALVGHRSGDVVEIAAPSGAWQARIISIAAAA